MKPKNKALEDSKRIVTKDQMMKRIRQSASGNPFKGYEKQISLIKKDLKK